LAPIRYATIVALYGEGKPAGLRSLLVDVQAGIADAVGVHFRPRPVHDIHSTIIGLESGGPVAHDRVAIAGIDVNGLCRHLEDSLARSPLTLRFGRFGDHGVSSRGSSLYQRTVVVSGDKVVLIGWPVTDRGDPTWRLDALRRELGRFGARHGYFQTPWSRDPDAYLVIGDLLDGWNAERLDACVQKCRAELSRTSCEVRLTAADVGLAIYTDTRLPADSTTVVALSEVGRLGG
jgi:hypothetical protein